MKPLSADEIRQAVHGQWLSRGSEVTVQGVSIDSRTAGVGQLFVAIRGPRHDGHDYMPQAAEAGCVAALVDRHAKVTGDLAGLFVGGLIRVDDTVKGLGELAGVHRRQLPATVVAVTGSNGKTTVKRMIHHILSRRLKGQASDKSFNNAIGLPLSLLSVVPTDDYVICEIGTNAPGEVLALARMARPDIAVITSVSEAHLEGLGDVQQVAVEKASLLSALESNGIAVVCGDSNALNRALLAYDSRIIQFGECDDCQLRLTGYRAMPIGQQFQLNDRLWVDLPVPGEHNARNALAAIAVAQRLGFSQDEAAAALSDFQGVAMRLQVVDAGPVRMINDAYNANPASVMAAWNVVQDIPAVRRVLVLGDMLELGHQAEQLHRRVGEDIAKGPVDLLIGVGSLARFIALGAAAEGIATATFETTEAAAAGAPALLTDGDVVLIKGSRSMGMERVVQAIGEKFS